MDGHIIDALPRLAADNLQYGGFGQIDVFVVSGQTRQFVDRHGADRYRAGRDYRGAGGVEVAAGAEIHHGIGAVRDCGTKFCKFGLRTARET
ncbi:hypothetical protein SDC9_146848 [bioreactor metagenome]|uniref:Uncharacterized protein n=1 Tax=bioreactor metagenome TaxID=1076179 RepID=A0A645EE03_9ZZZZ